MRILSFLLQGRNLSFLYSFSFLLALLLLAALPLSAQEKADTAACHVFRFVAADDMFYMPFGPNKAELERLEDYVATHRAAIIAGTLPLRVDGYCNSRSGREEKLAVAKLRSNRVKSELILRQGLTEDCFITHNHAGEGEWVIVRVKAQSQSPSNLTASSNLPPKGEALDSCAGSREGMDEIPNYKKVERKDTVATAQPAEPASSAFQSLPLGGRLEGVFRFNLLRWATLTPDVGLEWCVNRSWGILVHGSWTSWSWNDKDRRYALWEVSPEVRYYMGKERRGYLGAMYKAGSFNYKLSATGRQGDLMGGGITGGYQLRLNNALSLDFGLGIGCLHVDYEKYTVVDGVRVRGGKGSKNWWGPVSAGVTLGWKM